MEDLGLALGIAVGVVAAAAGIRWWLLGRRPGLGSAEDRATYATLHTASLVAPALRGGLDADSARRSLPHVQALLGRPTVGITGTHGTLAWSGPPAPAAVQDLVDAVIAGGGTQASGTAIAAPLVVEDRVVGSVVVVAEETSAGLARATSEVARWMSSQLELAELAASRTALMEAELRALRAQISPHFIYNSLGAIASFVRTDPERARALLLEFADFTRYSFRQHGEFTTLAEELRSIERYLVLEKARFGERLRVVVSVAPEVLNVTLPFLSVQPLVENAVRHGLEARPGTGTITVSARDAATECLIEIEDDGAGADPETVRAALAGRSVSGSVGLANVDERLRAVYGNDYGIVVETAPGLGTKVSLRVPKYAPTTVTAITPTISP
ncbi:ATPase/histidine kinase/DNA gyrase B/HSP90 domain protein [Aeromicrobium marinum DSM 15272]|uniref:ATPase/histidine kinase/DNA gyrase B/HSP90 domain protein n=1 Tax=Aeromicrobium marinum DSM 15272 TaxID=585531 RepID=E2SFE9_9ACTN|nr:histidine kinase [Aeromicrobium marinum]EFQ82050.1 ATPase/histidine kinase/DNA gyrase B/HSP90 domain protein [Aeromicrobium marinum DSM 15272]